MSTATIELSFTRRKLFDVLGDNQQQYLDHLKVLYLVWFGWIIKKHNSGLVSQAMLEGRI